MGRSSAGGALRRQRRLLLAAALLSLAALAPASGSPSFTATSATGVQEVEHAVMVRLAEALTYLQRPRIEERGSRGGPANGVYAELEPRPAVEWPLTEPDHCTWAGVVCATALGGRVISLDFNQLCVHNFINVAPGPCVELNGDSLAEVSRLQALEILRFSGVAIVGGGFPPEWSSLVRLQSLTIESWTTNSSLALQESWSTTYPAMQHMTLKNCNLSGTLPEAWHAGFALLQTLDIGDNTIGGSLPVSWALGFPELKHMRLGNNSLTGGVPPVWGSPSFPRLEILEISDNPLGGRLPDGWVPQPALNMFMANCGLEGTVPLALLRVTDLLIVASNNKLSGQLPPELCSSAIAFLDLQFNRLSGRLPSCKPSTSSPLRSLFLSSNALTGSLPPAWPSVFQDMTDLDLSSNPISGQIPLSWQQPGAFPHLTHLLLSKTLIDEIPFGIFGRLDVLLSMRTLRMAGCNINARLPDLPNVTYPPLREFVLDFSENRLSGSLPSSWSPFLATVTTINMSFNSLTGTLPASCLASAVRAESVVHFDFRGNALHGEITIPDPEIKKLVANGQTFLYVHPGNCLLCFPDTLGSESHMQVLPRQLGCEYGADYKNTAGTWPPCLNSRVPSCAALEGSRAAVIKGLLTFVFWASAIALIAYIYAHTKGGGGSRLDRPLDPFYRARRSPHYNAGSSLEMLPIYEDASQAPPPGSRTGPDSGRYVRNLLGEVTDMCENLSMARRGA